MTHLEVRAGSPPSGVEIIERYTLIGRPKGLADLWVWLSTTPTPS